jgi:hypothetical protein
MEGRNETAMERRKETSLVSMRALFSLLLLTLPCLEELGVVMLL